jgi:hypothetical protein
MIQNKIELEKNKCVKTQVLIRYLTQLLKLLINPTIN